jgi:AcrR family transcriptional regulator
MAQRTTRRRATNPVPRKQPRQGRAVFTVDALVIAVERILERHGPRGLTTNRVAEVAGVSVGTLYQYFPNKEALVGAVQARYLEHTFSLCRAVLAGAADVPMAQIVEGVRMALVTAYHAQRPIHRWLIDLRTAAGFQEPYRRGLDQLVAEVATFLAARRDLAIADPPAAAYTIVHAIHGVVTATAERNRQVDIEAIAAATAGLVAAYFVAAAVTSPRS